jgi:hypothetical protein
MKVSTMSRDLVDRDAALTAAREELAKGADPEPSLRELVQLLSDARWQSAITQAELQDSLSGMDT